MLIRLGFSVVLTSFVSLPVLGAGEFFGELVFVDGEVACDSYYSEGTVCRALAQPFAYSVNGLAWEASKGLITDGASIPVWARPFVGEPMTEAYARAATLHDHYCRPENNVRDYRSTHRMFHQALIDSGVDRRFADIMFMAVMIGGPKWSTLVPGEDCDLISGSSCIKTDDDLLPEWSAGSTNYSEAQFDLLPMDAILAEVAAELEAGNYTLREMEGLAALKRTELGFSLPPLYAVAAE